MDLARNKFIFVLNPITKCLKPTSNDLKLELPNNSIRRKEILHRARPTHSSATEHINAPHEGHILHRGGEPDGATTTTTTDNTAGLNKERDLPCNSKVNIFNVHIGQDVFIPANTNLTTTVRINKKIANSSNIVIHQNNITQFTSIPNIVTRVINNAVTINLSNIGNEDVLLTTGTKLCKAEYFKCSSNHQINIAHNNVMQSVEENYRPLTSDDIVCDNVEVKNKLLEIINRHRTSCWLPGESLGKYTGDQLEIKVKDNIVINKPPYRIL